MTELLKQGLYQPMHVTDQVLSIYAGTRGYLDKIPIKDVHAWEEGFLRFIHEQKNSLWQKITETRQLDDDAVAAVEQAIKEFDFAAASAVEQGLMGDLKEKYSSKQKTKLA
jgi:F-type H+-transporting ATPase subunit alpha